MGWRGPGGWPGGSAGKPSTGGIGGGGEGIAPIWPVASNTMTTNTAISKLNPTPRRHHQRRSSYSRRRSASLIAALALPPNGMGFIPCKRP